jgi:hypothetical protein
MSPESAIATLDRQIAAHGEATTLVFVDTGASVEKPRRAFVRGYSPQELVGGILQGDSLVIISPTGEELPRLPRRNDRVIIDGATRHVENVIPVRLNDELVRLSLQTRG